MSAFLLSQILVSGAVVCNLLSFQFKNRKIVLGFLTLSTFLVAWQLFFLGQIAAFWATLFAVVYFLVSTVSTDRRWLWLFLSTGLGIVWWNWASPLDWFVVASIAVTLTSIFNDNQKTMRELQMLGSLIRILYYAIIFSPIGILLEVVLLSSNLVSYWRFYLRRQPATVDYYEDN